MRDPRAPIINGHDFSGTVNQYSFQCEPYYEEGGNGGTFLDGSTVKDVLAVKERLSWTINSLTAERYAAMCTALNSGETPDLAVVLFKDPAINAIRKAAFHVVTRPPFLFSKEEPYFCTKAGAALILEESYHIERYAFTPPTQTDYAVGDSFEFALAGMSAAAYDAANTATNIMPFCVVVPADGSTAGSAGSIRVSVSYTGVEIDAFTVNVAELSVVASGDWWELYNNGKLRVFCEGDMPNRNPAPWASNRASIRKIAISDSVSSIGNYAFDKCLALTSVTIPNSVSTIGKLAFNECAHMTSVTIGDHVTSIGDNAFAYCSELTSITIPDSVSSIGTAAFHSCSGLTSAVILASVTSIADGLFIFCTSLTSVTIPDSVGSIGDDAFSGCARLSDVYYSGTQEQWAAISVGSGNGALSRATIHYSSGEEPI